MEEEELQAVDAFIRDYKELDGQLPPWRQDHGWEWTTRWGIINSHGAQLGELVFTINPKLTRPSISALYQKKLIYRLDIAPMDECKFNSYSAISVLGLPHTVCGPHIHPWRENREYVKANGFGELPNRKPVEIVDTLFIRALETASVDLNIHVTAMQRSDCEPPKQASLFAEEQYGVW